MKTSTRMSKARRAKGFRASKDPPNEQSGLCIMDLPSSISISILSILPLKCVLICRCVCRKWRNQINDSEFVKLHFSRVEAHPVIRMLGPKHISRMLYFVDQPPKRNHMHMKLDTKLKIPLRNAKLAMNCEKEAETNLPLKRKRVTKLRTLDHRARLVNSCNGFICLSEPFSNDPVMVCNPVTGQFIELPVPTESDNRSSVGCGFGFCPKTNQYKVVRTFGQKGNEMSIEPVTGVSTKYCRLAEIHTLGTNTWKLVGYGPPVPPSPTYLNGSINWLLLSCDNSPIPYYIASFDVGKESFQSIPIPPKRYGQIGYVNKTRICIGELRGCLCVSDASNDGIDNIEFWVMKTYGLETSWNIEINIDISTLRRRSYFRSFRPMSFSKYGTLLFFEDTTSSVFCYDPDNKSLKTLKVRGMKSCYEMISYIPSFISLKDAIIGDGVEVFDVESRCGGLRLHGESRDISLVEESHIKFSH